MEAASALPRAPNVAPTIRPSFCFSKILVFHRCQQTNFAAVLASYLLPLPGFSQQNQQ
jgi:hypothetical protein